MKLTPLGKVVILIVVIGGAAGGYRLFGPKLFAAASDKSSVDVSRIDLPSASGDTSTGFSGKVVMPGDEAGCTEDPEVRLLGYAWNAQMGMLFATGGPQATKGSLMCEHHVNFKWTRQDDNGKLQEALVSFATELSKGVDNPTKGAHFVTIMGDGGAAFLKGLNDALKRLGPEYQAKIVGSAGYSRGEDKFMGPVDWKADPHSAMGGFVAGVIRDGDWNIAQKWLGDNGLKNNPDEKTYDPDALNWVNASDYIDAATKYITGYSEDRPVVKNGKRTGQTKHITVQGLVTWTPGDVNVAKQKGGITSIVSTKEYTSQMPCVVIGIDKWMKNHRDVVQNMLLAIAEGGDAVRHSEAALKKGSDISAQVYGEKGEGARGSYWETYYKGARESDKSGHDVDLGGSSASNLADSLLAFGLLPGSANLVAATYTAFGNVDKAQYPELMSTFPTADQVIDTSYYRSLLHTNAPSQASVEQIKPKFSESKKTTSVISNKAWHIPFDSGRASFSKEAMKDLEKLRQDLLVAGNAAVEIHGHTDNVGDPAGNMQLSESRAFAVQKWLEKAFPVNFPKGRVKVVAHGQSEPLEPNSTGAGRAANRRVEIKLVRTSE